FYTLGYDTPAPLSEILGGSFYRRAAFADTVKQEVLVAGTEEINGMLALGIEERRKQLDAHGNETQWQKIVSWLAVEHQFIPIKTQLLDSKMPEHPTAVFEAEDWRELEPGMLVPFRGIKTYYEMVRGKPVQLQQVVTEFVKVDRNVSYDVSFFR